MKKNILDTYYKQVLNQNNWRERIKGIENLTNNRTAKAEYLVVDLARLDKVYKVKHKAFLLAQKWALTYKGQPIKLGRKVKGNLDKKINEKILKTHNSFDSDYTIEEFIDKFKFEYPKVFDLYDGEKGRKLNSFFIGAINTLPKKKKKEINLKILTLN